MAQLGYPRIGGVLKPQNLHLPSIFWIDRHLMYQLFHPIPCFLRTTTFRSQQTTTQLFSPDIDFFYALGNNNSSHSFTFCQQTKDANCWFLNPKMTHAKILLDVLSGWWFQPLWKNRIVKLGSSSLTRGENKTCLKPAPGQSICFSAWTTHLQHIRSRPCLKLMGYKVVTWPSTSTVEAELPPNH